MSSLFGNARGDSSLLILGRLQFIFSCIVFGSLYEGLTTVFSLIFSQALVSKSYLMSEWITSSGLSVDMKTLLPLTYLFVLPPDTSDKELQVIVAALIADRDFERGGLCLGDRSWSSFIYIWSIIWGSMLGADDLFRLLLSLVLLWPSSVGGVLIVCEKSTDLFSLTNTSTRQNKFRPGLVNSEIWLIGTTLEYLESFFFPHFITINLFFWKPNILRICSYS